MSKAYLLVSEDRGYNCNVEKVFSSYSAMLTWLKESCGYESDLYPTANEHYGKFKEAVIWYGKEHGLYYEVHDLIGEHCPRTGCLKLD